MKNWFFLLVFLSGTVLSFGQEYKDLWDLYEKGDYELLVELSDAYLSEEPDNSTLNTLAGRSYVDLGKFQKAIPYLSRAINSKEISGNNLSWLYNYRAKCFYSGGKISQSKNDFDNSIQISPQSSAARSSGSWCKTLGMDPYYSNWTKLETTNFIFHFHPETPLKDKQLYTREHEYAFQQISRVFYPDLLKKIDLFVWPSHEHGKEAGFQSIGFAKPEFCVIHSRYNQTKGHEMTHVLTHQAIHPIHKTPLINEGVAVFHDLEKGNKMDEAISVTKGRKINIEKLWKNWESLPTDVSYPVAGAFCGYLMKRSEKEQYFALLKEQSFENAKFIYGPDLFTIIADFEKALLN